MWIEVEYEGRTYAAREDEELTFGRGAQTSIFLGTQDTTVNRVVGRFRHRNGRWVLENLGSYMDLRLHDAESRVDGVIKPQGSLAIDWPEVTVSFASGQQPPTVYEFLVMQSMPETTARTELPSFAGEATRVPDAFRTRRARRSDGWPPICHPCAVGYYTVNPIMWALAISLSTFAGVWTFISWRRRAWRS